MENVDLLNHELDVVAIRGGRLLACECKTGKAALERKTTLELAAKGRALGTFTDIVLVTDAPGLSDPNYRGEKYGSTLSQAVRALSLDIAIIGREDLPNLSEKLSDPEKLLRDQKRWFGLGA